MYYKSAEAILLAFSLTDSETFENLPKWVREIDQNATKTNCVKILVGTKSDLDAQKEVQYKECQKFAKQNGMFFFETSSKANTNIKEMFDFVANCLFQI